MGLPNAFAVLQQSGKRKPTEPSPKDGASADKKHKNSTDSEGASQSSFGDCPLCNKKVPKSLLEFHINGCLDGILEESPVADTSHQTFAQSLPELSQPVSEGPSAQSQPVKTPSAPQAASATAGNAFAHMMQRQRERSQTWSFFLGRHPDGAYYWHMWRDKHIPADAANTGVVKAEPGLDEAAQQRLVSAAKWSASVQVPLSALECRCESGPAAAETKVALRLLTDIQPGSEEELKALGDGAAEKASGKAWVFTGTSSLLKSALQKNVRLGRADAAVRVALHLLKLDASELLRRTCIICLEDALLHPSLPLLVWLMAAVPKGYALGRMLALACLTIIHEIASVPVRAQHTTGPAGGSSSLPGLQLAPAAGDLVRCIMLRAAYGGMGGDVSMLQKFAATWKHRFECVETLSLLKGAPVTQRTAQPDAPWMAYLHQQFSAAAGGDLQQLGCMEPGDIPLSAVDFHVSNIIEEVLNNREVLTAALAVGRDPLQAMRDTIWIFSSSTNSRAWLQAPEQERQERLRTRRSELEGIWKLAAPAAKNFARKYIKARFREL